MLLVVPFAWELGKFVGKHTVDTPLSRFWYSNLNYPNYYNDPDIIHKARNTIMGLFGFPVAAAREFVWNVDEFVAFHSDKILDVFHYTPPEPWHSLYEQRNFGDVFKGGPHSVSVDRIIKYS